MRGAASFDARNQGGFTLVELLLVCCIIATLVAISLPRLGGSTRSLHFEESVRNLADTIRYARSEAVRRRLKVRLNVDESGREYSLSLQHAGNSYGEQFTDFGDALLDTPQTLPDGVRIEGIEAGGRITKPSPILFSPNGVGVPSALRLVGGMAGEAKIEIGPWYEEVFVRGVSEAGSTPEKG